MGATLSDLELPIDSIETIKKFMDERKDMLVFCSKPGIGKTYLCASMVYWALENFNFLRYHPEKMLLSRLREGISEGHGDYAQALQYYIDDDVVMLDDVGSWWNRDKVSNRDNEWKIEIFFQFLDYRYSNRKPTIITSNLHKKDFEEVYSPRIVSRLFSAQNKIVSIFEDDATDKRTLGM